MTPGILVLDPAQKELEGFARDLESLGYRPFATTDPEKAFAFLKAQHLSLIFCDVLSLSGNGLGLLSTLHRIDPGLPVIILTGFTTIEAAAAAVREGASFYLLRPLALDSLKLAVEQGLGHRRGGSLAQSSELEPQHASTEIIVGASQPVQQVLELAGRIARSNANIIIFGESGTGKELFAKIIHSCSQRAEGAFIPVDCASLPENLLEAELFGYEKGAFTGAVHTKPGLMQLAHRGTLFFDEIAELPKSLQPKLLRALQERQHRRLGGTDIVDFDVRIVSATNRDLRELVSQRQFRQDLFYRLNVVPLHLPPLRARDRDVVLLANHFLKECLRKSFSAAKHFAPEVLGFFQEYQWPGNVRELQNVVEYACAVARTEMVTPEDLPAELQICNQQVLEVATDLRAPTFKMAKARFESAYVTDLLKRHNNNISRAAKAAGIDRKTFYSLLRKHHLTTETQP